MASTIQAIGDLQLDNTIKFVSAGEGVEPHYYAANSVVKSEFYQTGNRVVFKSKGRRFEWTPQNLKYIDAFGIEDVVYTVQDVPLEVKANYARYNRSMPDVDDWFIVENDRLKHQILVQGFQRDPMPWLTPPIDFVIGGTIQFDPDLKVYADGAEQTGTFETSGQIEIRDGDEIVFTLPQVVAYDSRVPERASTTGKYRARLIEPGVLEFDIVVSNEWISDLARVYPIVIDPTVVVSSAYNTAGNNGRKIVRLSNGWLIAIAHNSTNSYTYVYKSTDNGNTWSQLCYISGSNAGAAIANVGNVCHILFNNSTTVYSVSFDATTVTNTDQNPNKKVVDTQTSISNNVSICADGNGHLHAVWASKNSSYPNSFNVRYAKSTNGGATWSSPTQLTLVNSTGKDCLNPCVAVMSDNNPVIAYNFSYPSNSMYWIESIKYNGTGWFNLGTTLSSDSSLYRAQQNVCIAVDLNDVVHLVWQGKDSIDSSKFNIVYCKIANGTSTIKKLTSGNAYDQLNPSITVDGNNKIHVFWHGIDSSKSTKYNNVRKTESSDGGLTWSPVTTITSNTSTHAQNVQTLWSKFNMNSSDTVRWIYMDSNTVKYDQFVSNSTPNAPTNLQCANFDATQEATFTWTFSDPDPVGMQSAYQLVIYRVSDGEIVYDSGKVASTTSSHTLPAGTLVNNTQYQWQVRTWDQHDAVSPYSSLATFWCSAQPSVTITYPASDGDVVVTSSMTVEWLISDPESEGQSAYQVTLTDENDVVIWDSGKVANANARSLTIDGLQNNTSYKVKVTVWDAKDVASTESVRLFNVQYTPPPIPSLTTAAEPDNGRIKITITNPTPQGTEPNVTNNDLYRRKQGETTWTRIAMAIPENGTYYDYTAASGVVYEYKVRANGDNTAISESSPVVGSIALNGVWLHDVADPEGTIWNFQYDGGRDSEWRAEAEFMQFAGRAKPVVEFGEQEEGRVKVTLQLLRNTQDLDKLQTLVRRKGTICYRDGRGRKVYGVITSLPVKDEPYGYSVEIEVNETAYNEGV